MQRRLHIREGDKHISLATCPSMIMVRARARQRHWDKAKNEMFERVLTKKGFSLEPHNLVVDEKAAIKENKVNTVWTAFYGIGCTYLSWMMFNTPIDAGINKTMGVVFGALGMISLAYGTVAVLLKRLEIKIIQERIAELRGDAAPDGAVL